MTVWSSHFKVEKRDFSTFNGHFRSITHALPWSLWNEWVCRGSKSAFSCAALFFYLFCWLAWIYNLLCVCCNVSSSRERQTLTLSAVKCHPSAEKQVDCYKYNSCFELVELAKWLGLLVGKLMSLFWVWIPAPPHFCSHKMVAFEHRFCTRVSVTFPSAMTDEDLNQTPQWGTADWN